MILKSSSVVKLFTYLSLLGSCIWRFFPTYKMPLYAGHSHVFKSLILFWHGASISSPPRPPLSLIPTLLRAPTSPCLWSAEPQQCWEQLVHTLMCLRHIHSARIFQTTTIKSLATKKCSKMVAERRSARMSKITNDGLTRSGTGCYIAVPMWQQWVSKGKFFAGAQ